MLALKKANSKIGMDQREIECLKSYLGFDNERELKWYLEHYFLE